MWGPGIKSKPNIKHVNIHYVTTFLEEKAKMAKGYKSRLEALF